MLIKKKTLERIKNVIEKNYNRLLITVVGSSAFSKEELESMRAQGIDISNPDSLLEMVYYHNLLNPPKSQDAPTSVEDMKRQQTAKPAGELHEAAEEHLNENFRHLVEKLKGEVQSRVEGIIREQNLGYRADYLQNLDQPEGVKQLIKEQTVSKIKQELRDYTKDAERNWTRVAVTEVSNAIGLGSADRIVKQNEGKDLGEVYVYRIVVNDASLCKYCRQFYLDEDGTPTVYRMSTLLNNGTNYGKKAVDWKAVAAASHPNERCGPVIELRPGWKVKSGGNVEFIGREAWDEYIQEKVRG